MAQAMLQKVKIRLKEIRPLTSDEISLDRFYGVNENGMNVDFFKCPQCGKRVDIQYDPPDSFKVNCLQNCRVCNTEFSVSL